MGPLSTCIFQEVILDVWNKYIILEWKKMESIEMESFCPFPWALQFPQDQWWRIGLPKMFLEHNRQMHFIYRNTILERKQIWCAWTTINCHVFDHVSCSRCFLHMILFNPLNDLWRRYSYYFFPFYRWGNWNTETFRDFLRSYI